jgi:hypothetical protein
MDESTSQAHRMFVRDEDDLTTHEKAWVEAQVTLQVIHQEPNMDSMEDSEKFVMKQIRSGFWQNFDEAIEKSCIDEKIHSQLLELCKCRSLNRRITPNMLTNELQVLHGQPNMAAYNMEFMESCFQLEARPNWHKWDMLDAHFLTSKFLR